MIDILIGLLCGLGFIAGYGVVFLTAKRLMGYKYVSFSWKPFSIKFEKE